MSLMSFRLRPYIVAVMMPRLKEQGTRVLDSKGPVINQGAQQRWTCGKPSGNGHVGNQGAQQQLTCGKPRGSTAMDLWETRGLNSNGPVANQGLNSNGPVGNQGAPWQWTCGKLGGSTAMDLWGTRGLNRNGLVGNHDCPTSPLHPFWGINCEHLWWLLYETVILQPLLCTLSGK